MVERWQRPEPIGMEKRVPGVIGQKAGVDTAFYRAVHNEEKIVKLLNEIRYLRLCKAKGVGTVKVGKNRKNESPMRILALIFALLGIRLSI